MKKLTVKAQNDIIAELQEQEKFYNISAIISKLACEQLDGIVEITAMELLEILWSI